MALFLGCLGLFLVVDCVEGTGRGGPSSTRPPLVYSYLSTGNKQRKEERGKDRKVVLLNLFTKKLVCYQVRVRTWHDLDRRGHHPGCAWTRGRASCCSGPCLATTRASFCALFLRIGFMTTGLSLHSLWFKTFVLI